MQSLGWWRSDGLEVDDLALGIYGYIDFDLGRGVAMPERERKRESWVKNNERKFFLNWLEKGGFGLLTLCHLSKTHMQFMCYKFQSNIKVKLMHSAKCNKSHNL